MSKKVKVTMYHAVFDCGGGGVMDKLQIFYNDCDLEHFYNWCANARNEIQAAQKLPGWPALIKYKITKQSK